MDCRECPICHAEVITADKFCSACGASLDQEAAPTPAAICNVVGVVGNAQLRQGLLRQATFSLVVTPDQVIAARVTSQMLRDEAKRVSAEAKANGKGMLRRIGATMLSGFTFHERYLHMPPDQALAEHASNFALPLTSIKSIKTRTYLMQDDSRQRRDDLIIKTTAGGKYVFRLAPNAAASAAKVFRSVLGNRVK